MTIKALPIQIPVLWETIKWVCKQAEEVQEKDLPAYCNELLQALLNSKAQCWVRLDADKQLTAMLITRLLSDRITGDKYLFLQALYSFVKVEDSVWLEERKLIGDFCNETRCKYVLFESKNPKVWALAGRLGFKEKSRAFVLEGGS